MLLFLLFLIKVVNSANFSDVITIENIATEIKIGNSLIKTNEENSSMIQNDDYIGVTTVSEFQNDTSDLSIVNTIDLKTNDDGTSLNQRNNFGEDENVATEHISELLIIKCCEAAHFYNLTTSTCELNENDNEFEEQTTYLIEEDALKTIKWETRSLSSCPIYDEDLKLFPPPGISNLTHSLHSSGHLIEHKNDIEFDHQRYCLEMMDFGDGMKVLSAVFCIKFFRKCCYLLEGLSGPSNNLICSNAHAYPSLHMEQLLQLITARYGLPEEPECTPYQLGGPEKSERFFVTSSGELTLTFDNMEFTTHQYCVDDYIDNANTSHLMALVCKEIFPQELRPTNPNNLPLGTIGKCCPLGDHIVEKIMDNSTGKYIDFIHLCVTDGSDYDILTDGNIIVANATNITYTNFPHCENGIDWITYELSVDEEDNSHLDAFQNLIWVSKNGKCIKDKITITKDKYCLDYKLNGSQIKLVAIACRVSLKIENENLKKPIIMATSLGISCAALIATTISLLRRRVRKSSFTVKLVNTLSGKIMLSYVLSYLVGFLALAVAQTADIEGGYNLSCRAIAGILMFFNLSAFHWNTSICLEAVLLTMHVRTSEGFRYLFHSLWAWGLPGIITALALSLDAYTESLPCNIITPKIGVFYCFISDPLAMLLYFYLPMFITLLTNMVLLPTAKAIRSHNLKKLEHGPKRREIDDVENIKLHGGGGITGVGTKTENQEAHNKGQPKPTKSSGMRIHQNRNLWLEAVKLVMLSGVTLLFEIIAFLLFLLFGVKYRYWHDYLVYISTVINSLRGLGIFVILVMLTDENKKKIAKALDRLRSMASRVHYSAPKTHSRFSSGTSAVGKSSIQTNSTSCSNNSGVGKSQIQSQSSHSSYDSGEGKSSIHTQSSHSFNDIEVESLSFQIQPSTSTLDRINSKTWKTKL